jgi:hypothetical protein
MSRTLFSSFTRNHRHLRPSRRASLFFVRRLRSAFILIEMNLLKSVPQPQRV